ACRPGGVRQALGGPEFHEHAVVLFDEEDVAIAILGGVGAAFNVGVGRDGISAGIALVGVVERDFGGLNVRVGEGEGDSTARVCAEVGVQAHIGADAGDVRLRRRIERELVDGDVPDVVRGEDGAACDLGAGGGWAGGG